MLHRRDPVLTREDVDAILGVLFDIHVLLARIARSLGEDDEEEEADPDA